MSDPQLAHSIIAGMGREGSSAGAVRGRGSMDEALQTPRSRSHTPPSLFPPFRIPFYPFASLCLGHPIIPFRTGYRGFVPRQPPSPFPIGRDCGGPSTSSLVAVSSNRNDFHYSHVLYGRRLPPPFEEEYRCPLLPRIHESAIFG